MTGRVSHLTDEELHDLIQQGLAIYDDRLRQVLEPAHNDEYVVIHVDTGDYAVAPHRIAAIREMRTRHPADGRLVGRKIGGAPDYDLAARIFAGSTVDAK